MDKDVIITLDDSALADLAGARKRVLAAGAKIHNINEITGTARAQIHSSALERLRAVPGVLAVEDSGSVQIAPPDSPIQ
jgi:hypothetical protein